MMKNNNVALPRLRKVATDITRPDKKNHMDDPRNKPRKKVRMASVAMKANI